MSDAHLAERVALVEQRIRRAVAARRAVDPTPDDPFRGLYLADEAVQRLLDRPVSAVPGPDTVDEGRLAEAERLAEVTGSRLRSLRLGFELEPLDVELLLVALVPDLDARFEQLYGYLNDDVTRRRPTIGLALALCGVPAVSAAARGRFVAPAPLPGRGLLLVEEADRPFLGRSLRVPDRVAAHLLGDDAPDRRLAELLLPVRPLRPGGGRELGHGLGHGCGRDRLAAAMEAVGLVYLREPAGGSARGVAVEALRAAGRAALVLDLNRLARDPAPTEVLVAVGREAGFGGPREDVGAVAGAPVGASEGMAAAVAAGVVAGPVEALAERPELVRALTELPVPVLLTGRGSWEPEWSARVPLLVETGRLGAADRAGLWRAALPEAAVDLRVAAPFELSPEQVGRAARTAEQQALLAGGPLTEVHLLHGVRAQNSSGLERLARRIEPGVGWVDLVLPPAVLGQLRELAARARHRDRVLGDWAMRPGGGRGRGVMALFAGDSGTGKTLSAEVIAGELGLDLYTVDLATVVDKYVGVRPRRNLERIFTEAAGVNAVLLFDEADAIFGKRSEVRDAPTAYANVESAYLLQRMESFDAWPCSPPTCGPTSTSLHPPPRPGGGLPAARHAQRTALWERLPRLWRCRAATTSTSPSADAPSSWRRRHPLGRRHRRVPGGGGGPTGGDVRGGGRRRP
ncbi:ATP-binding protein [Kitasatospora albolonga]|uniref:ATP-binding protein n=1 Tax=Kitasatospora albolonga TaxID=68173 RepID=UPI00337317A9